MTNSAPQTEIRIDAPWVTEMTFLHCADDMQDELAHAATVYAEQLTAAEGFVAVNVLLSNDGSRVLVYTQWRHDHDARAAHEVVGDPGWADLIDSDSGGTRLYDIVYADDRSPEGVSIIGPAERDIIFVNEIRTLPDKQDRLLELVIANNEESSFNTPGYRSANFHKSRDGHRAVNYSLWDTEDHLIDAISDMAAADVNLEETIAIANPDFRFYTLAHARHARHA